jgi:hypothetical protein
MVAASFALLLKGNAVARTAKPHVSRHKVMNKPRAGVRAPVLLLSGNWLAAAGFTISEQYAAVVVAPGCIVLLTLRDPEQSGAEHGAQAGDAAHGLPARQRALSLLSVGGSLSIECGLSESDRASLASHLEDSESDRASL